jgi:hypothetical protein
MAEIQDYFKDFMQEIYSLSGIERGFDEAIFVERMCDFLVDQAVMPDYANVQYKKDSLGLKVDAYHFDDDLGTLRLIVSHFHTSLETLTQTDSATIFKRPLRFFEKALDHSFFTALEESDPAYQLAREIYFRSDAIKQIKVTIITNSVISNRLKGLESRSIAAVPCHFDIWDLDRLYKLSSSETGTETIVINFKEDIGRSIACLPAHVKSSDCESYLFVLPGEVLAALYEKYDERLLEQNVRTFLQFRGGVNKGMRNTILNQPSMFFAYNNGITATAEGIGLKNERGATYIESLTNLQIVNGGQTTASIYNTLINSKADLSNVHVQVKLTVVPPEDVEQVVPKISEYANTQNKVNAADFFANHPFHLRIEEFSRRLWAPASDGGLKETHWFYERARGQYGTKQANLSSAKKREFLLQNPLNQMLTKTDLAKYEASWDMLPYRVSQGAQKNFVRFADEISKAWDKNEESFSELYFKRLIAKAIIFRSVDKQIMKQEWYAGYKANIVTYTLALLSQRIDAASQVMDLKRIWELQTVPLSVLDEILVMAKTVNDKILDTPKEGMNIGEWCKKQDCWERVKASSAEIGDQISAMLITKSSATERNKDAKQVQRIDNDIAAQTYVMEKGAIYWNGVKSWNDANNVLTPKELGILRVAANKGSIPTSKQSLALLSIERKCVDEGLPS